MKKKTLLLKIVICLLAIMVICLSGCGKKGEKKNSSEAKQEVNKKEKEEDKDLPILSNDGEELKIEKDETSNESEKGSNDTKNNESKENPDDSSKEESEESPEQDEKDDPVELPFVPADKF